MESIRHKEGKLQNFFIGDLQEKNILVDKNTKKIQLCDIDSCKIGDNIPFCARYSFLKSYSYVSRNLQVKYPMYNTLFIPNKNFELYCYIVIIFNTLFHINIRVLTVPEYYQILYSLKRLGLPEPLFQIFINIYSLADNQNPYSFLDKIPTSLERKLNL